MAEEQLVASVRLEQQAFERALQAAARAVEQMSTSASKAIARLDDAVTKTVGSLRNLGEAAGHQATRQAGSDAQQAARQFDTLGHSATRTREALRNAGHEATTVGHTLRNTFQSGLQVAAGLGIVTTVQSIISGLKNLAVESVNAATRLQALQTSMRVLTGSSGAAQVSLGFVRQEANRLGIHFETAARGFQQLTAAARGTALEGQKTRDIFTAVTSASRALGLTTEETGGTITALTQIISKGTVQSEELRGQLGERLPGAFQIAARAMGVTTQELSKMLEQGQVLANDFLPRLAAQLQRELGQGAVTAAQTAQAAFVKLSNTVKELAASIGTEILGILHPVATVLDQFLQKVTRIRRENDELRRANIQGLLAGTGLEPEAATPEETRRLAELALQQQTLQANLGRLAAGAAQRETAAFDRRLQEVLDGIKKRQRLAAQEVQELEAEALVFGPQGPAPFASAIKAATQLSTDLQDTLKAINIEADLFGKGDNLKLARARLSEVDKTANKLSETFAKTPAILQTQPPEIRKIVEETLAARTEAEKHVKALEAQEKAQRKVASEAESAAKKAERDAARLEKQRQEALASVVQGDPFRLQDQSLTAINAALAYYNNLLTTETGPRLQAVKIILNELDQAKRLALGEVPPELRRELGEIEKALSRATAAVQAIGTDATLTQPFETFEAALDALRQRLQEFAQDRNRALVQPSEGLLQGFRELEGAMGALQAQFQDLQASKLHALAQAPPELQQQVQDLTAQFAILRDILQAIAADPAALTVFLPQLQKMLGELRQGVGDVAKEVREFEKQQQKIRDIITSFEVKATRTRVDDVRAENEAKLTEIRKYATNVATIREAETKAAARLQHAQTEETAKALQQQSREYKQFAKQVQDTVADQLFDVLSGRIRSFNDLLGSLRTTFLRVLSQMIAAAIARPIIIPVVTALVGSVGSVLGGLLSGQGGAAGGGGGGGNTIRALLGVGQQANTLSGALGGPTAQSLIPPGSFFGQGGTLQHFLNTPLFGTGTGLAAGAGAGLGGGALTPAAAGALFGSAAATEFAAGLAAGAGAGVGGGGLASAGASFGSAAAAEFAAGGTISGIAGASSGLSVAPAAGAAITGSSLISGVGAGVAAGFALSQFNKLIGLDKALGTRGSNALAGAGGGALAGTIILPGIGTAIGAALGALLGGLLGGGRPKPRFTIEDIGRPLIDFVPGVGITTQGSTLSTRAANIGSAHPAVRDFVGSATDQLFASLTQTLRQFPEALQERAVPELRRLADEFSASFRNVRFKGKDIQKQVERFVQEQLPETFNSIFNPLLESLQRVAPVLKQLDDAITALEQRQAQVLATLQGARRAITEGLFTPAQSFETRRRELQDLLSRATTPEAQAQAAPQIAALTQEVFRLATQGDVFGDDLDAVREVQQELVGILDRTEAATRKVFDEAIAATRAQQEILLNQFQVQQSIENYMAQAVQHLQSIAGLLQPVGSFQTLPGETRQVHLTGLARVHEGEIVSRSGGTTVYGGDTYHVTVNVPSGERRVVEGAVVSALERSRRDQQGLHRIQRYRQTRTL